MLHDIISIAGIMERYGCERQTASDVMHELNPFRMGGKLFAYVKDLVALEESRREYPAPRKRACKVTEPVRIPRRRAT